MKENIRIAYIWQKTPIREFCVEDGERSFHVIYGQQINGWFCCIPDWQIGCELSFPNDLEWNRVAIGRAMKNKERGEMIARAISCFEMMREEGESK